MSRFCLREISASNYRCFETLTLPLEEDATVFFAENGGGKTALLVALAMGLATLQRGAPKTLRFNPARDIRLRTLDEKGRREPVGRCELTWTADVGEAESVTWATAVRSESGRTTTRHRPILEAIEQVRAPGERWPLFAWYGVDRLTRRLDGGGKVARVRDRWEAYESSLNPNLDETALLQWLQDEMLGDVSRRDRSEPERFFHKAVLEAAVRATPGVKDAWYDATARSPVVCFDDGQAAPWSELSDGYHVFIALVADIARRAVMLNEFDGADAPARVEGVVLIDELDLHLHPRWQRVALPRLRAAFPRLQFVITTHSPQVLSSAENHQVRWFVDGQLQKHNVFVSGRDTNAILRDLMHTDDRDDEGVAALRSLHDAIDRSEGRRAKQVYRKLVERWGSSDPALIRAKGLMEE